jgi:hypothetical protein
MKPTPEQIAAYADGQLEGIERDAVAQALAADPVLEQQVAKHLALKARLAGHFAPIAEEPVPDQLAALLASASDNVTSLAEARERRKGPPRWVWLAGPALAASLVLAISLRPAADSGYLEGQAAMALEQQLVAQQATDASVRVLLSFRDASGSYCRAYESGEAAGIACRDAKGWKLRQGGQAEQAQSGEYRQATSAGEILARAQSLAAGPALDEAEEMAARARGWSAAAPQ